MKATGHTLAVHLVMSAFALIVAGIYLAIDAWFLKDAARVYEFIAAIFIIDTAIMFILVPIVPGLIRLVTNTIIRWSLILPAVVAVVYVMKVNNELYGLLVLPLMVLGYARYDKP